MRKQRITERVGLRDVARRAGVSTATVSRVLNGSGVVRESTRRAVEDACQELDYVLNGAARALSSRRTMAIGAVVPTLQTETFSRALATFQKTVHEHGYTLLVASSGFSASVELREVTTLLEHGIDALMVVGNSHDEKMWTRIRREDTPYVQTWTLDRSRPSVGFDHFATAYRLAEHLLDLGHTRFAVIVGTPPSNDRGSARIDGTRAALRQRSVELPDTHLITNSFTLDDARRSMETLWDLPERPTAVICGNDVLAFGALTAAKERGLSVPGDISIAGFNDFYYASHLDPPLTTVRVDLEEMGRASGRYLVGVLAGHAPPPQTVVPTELIVRGSTGPAPPL